MGNARTYFHWLISTVWHPAWRRMANIMITSGSPKATITGLPHLAKRRLRSLCLISCMTIFSISTAICRRSAEISKSLSRSVSSIMMFCSLLGSALCLSSLAVVPAPHAMMVSLAARDCPLDFFSYSVEPDENIRLCHSGFPCHLLCLHLLVVVHLYQLSVVFLKSLYGAL